MYSYRLIYMNVTNTVYDQNCGFLNIKAANTYAISSRFDSPIKTKPLVVDVSRSHSDTPHFVRLPWTLDRPFAESSQLTTHINPKRQNIHAPVGM